MTNLLQQYYRLAEPLVFDVSAGLSADRGYFRFGESAVCYGRTSSGDRSPRPDQALYDVSREVVHDGKTVRLPFDPAEVVTNLTRERYAHPETNGTSQTRVGWVRRLYYLVRPALPLGLRSQMQKLYLRDWRSFQFPAWPVDCTLEELHKKLLLVALKAAGKQHVPFVWFWPEGASASSIMTHDVEAEPGREFCSTVMDIDDEFGIPASFQVVPERRYEVAKSYIEQIKARGYEVNVQDLYHDGRLFWHYETFKCRAAQINQYGREFDACGFRSAILYRNQEWYQHLKFEYDMSVPNVGHLDPQRGGCCTVMPYFIGDILELPVTTTQDHSLFHVLGDHSTDLWQQQIDIILKQNGLISFIIHPDYIMDARSLATYRSLLLLLGRLRSEKNIWIARPGEVNRWWRARAQMTVVREGEGWSVQGPEKERARVAFASIVGDKIEYSFSEPRLRECCAGQHQG